MCSRLIEEKFPIKEISELAIPERSSYKPIYQISKWFARRSSSTFRAILLGSILPKSADLMDEFYKNHDFSDITVFDPFVGGGTTIIEALRLGLNCIGIDLNPVAWFITKTEAELIDINKLQAYIEDCTETIGYQIQQWYKTSCPICKRQADIIYAHWVKLVVCAECNEEIPLFKSFIVGKLGENVSIFCSGCEAVFSCKTPVPSTTVCPHCQSSFNASRGTRISRKTCNCLKCSKMINILDYEHKFGRQLPYKLFAIEGYCPHCASDRDQESPLSDTRYKFIKGISNKDITLYKHIEEQWKLNRSELVPRVHIPEGDTTKTLHNHNYEKWADLFNSRQLLALSTILEYINKISDQVYQEMLLAAFINLLNHNNIFTRYSPHGQKVEGIFARHDFHPLSTFAENNVWGTKFGRGSWVKCLKRLIEGKKYNNQPFNRKDGKKVFSGKIDGRLTTKEFEFNDSVNLFLLCQDSEKITDYPFFVDLIISDPPYADNINYSELSDFFYVWIRGVLKGRYDWFLPTETPKDTEAILSKKRSLDYYDKLIRIFKAAKSKLKPNGLLVFTFHHSSKEKWFKIGEVLLKTGFQVVKTYPIPSEARNVLTIQKKKAISFDLIIICQKVLKADQAHIQLDKFIQIFEDSFQRRINFFQQADISVQHLDYLALYLGILLEMDSKYYVNSDQGHKLSRKEIWETCDNFISL
jgi:adenine-specific DNA methylase